MKCHRKDQRHRRAARARHAGFTLIEIMIVIGIIGIVLAMGAPPFVRMLQKDSLRQAVGDITEACSRARAAAILQGEATELVIRAADGQLTVAPAPDTRMEAGAAGEGSAGQPAEAGVPKPSLFGARLHEDIAVTLLYVNLKDRMKTEESRVHFYPNGTSDEFTIILQMGRGVRKISLDCVTGLANVEVIR